MAKSYITVTSAYAYNAGVQISIMIKSIISWMPAIEDENNTDILVETGVIYKVRHTAEDIERYLDRYFEGE